MKKILIVIVLTIVSAKSFSQQTLKKITVVDTIQLTGILIYDTKNEVMVLKRNFTDTTSIENAKQIKRLIRKSEYVFLDPFKLKTLMARQETEVYKFCTDPNRDKFGFNMDNLLFKRYALIPFANLYFINLTIDNEKLITLKCF